MKFEITLEDFWLDEDESLESALKKHIIQEVTAHIQSSIKNKVEEHITRRVKEEVEKKLFRTIDAAIIKSLETGQIKGSNNQLLTFNEYIHEMFISSSRWNTIPEQVKKIADNCADSMKARYDLTFASQLVVKMNQNGLLKKDVAKLLLGDGKG